MTDYYLRGLKDDFVNSLKLLNDLLKKAEVEINWKWVIIVYHNLLQNCFILDIGNNLGTMKKIGFEEYKKIFFDEKDLQKILKLISKVDIFMNLFKKFGIPHMTHAQQFKKNQLLNKSMNFLNYTRNEYIHMGNNDLSWDSLFFLVVLKQGIKVIDYTLSNKSNAIWDFYVGENSFQKQALIQAKDFRIRLGELLEDKDIELAENAIENKKL